VSTATVEYEVVCHRPPTTNMTLYIVATGLILADSMNMLLRITFSLVYLRFVSGTSAGVRLADFVPSYGTLTALCAAFLITGAQKHVAYFLSRSETLTASVPLTLTRTTPTSAQAVQLTSC
jgi:Rft protein